MVPTAIRLPDWVQSLPIAVWVTDTAMTLRYVNDRAERLLRPPQPPLGCPCFNVICGRNREGRPFCSPDCPASAAIRHARAVEAVDLQIGPDEGRWVRLFVAPLDLGADSRPLIHIAFEMTERASAERFVGRVAERTRKASARRLAALSNREREVLALLAQDKTARAVADELHISYATVRNHIQHVLAKMDAHSMLEAIACWVLSQAPERPRADDSDPR